MVKPTLYYRSEWMIARNLTDTNSVTPWSGRNGLFFYFVLPAKEIQVDDVWFKVEKATSEGLLGYESTVTSKTLFEEFKAERPTQEMRNKAPFYICVKTFALGDHEQEDLRMRNQLCDLGFHFYDFYRKEKPTRKNGGPIPHGIVAPSLYHGRSSINVLRNQTIQYDATDFYPVKKTLGKLQYAQFTCSEDVVDQVWAVVAQRTMEGKLGLTADVTTKEFCIGEGMTWYIISLGESVEMLDELVEDFMESPSSQGLTYIKTEAEMD